MENNKERETVSPPVVKNICWQVEPGLNYHGNCSPNSQEVNKTKIVSFTPQLHLQEPNWAPKPTPSKASVISKAPQTEEKKSARNTAEDLKIHNSTQEKQSYFITLQKNSALAPRANNQSQFERSKVLKITTV